MFSVVAEFAFVHYWHYDISAGVGKWVKYSKEDFFQSSYLRYNEDYSTIFYKFSVWFPTRCVPVCQMIHKLHLKFKTTGSIIDVPHSNLPPLFLRSAVNEYNMHLIAQAFKKLTDTPCNLQYVVNELNLQMALGLNISCKNHKSCINCYFLYLAVFLFFCFFFCSAVVTFFTICKSVNWLLPHPVYNSDISSIIKQTNKKHVT